MDRLREREYLPPNPEGRRTKVNEEEI